MQLSTDDTFYSIILSICYDLLGSILIYYFIGCNNSIVFMDENGHSYFSEQ